MDLPVELPRGRAVGTMPKYDEQRGLSNASIPAMATTAEKDWPIGKVVGARTALLSAHVKR
ncbi:hypothetical protein KAK06_15145 [Ideonella sp. 4Y11]|uniref:Uncharacterized protein n=1 Tax=Ideonella aquatica TaxID=2824119 RepID=A0A940YLW2_9BURK|nr:hypothetical protein [Ideonella aquatica]MBQ0960289.1 hypothetical protein [Ideonella aquatica]